MKNIAPALVLSLIALASLVQGSSRYICDQNQISCRRVSPRDYTPCVKVRTVANNGTMYIQNGFAIGRARGTDGAVGTWILTADHIFQGEPGELSIYDGKRWTRAMVYHRDTNRDLALIWATGIAMPCWSIALNDPAEGSVVVNLGYEVSSRGNFTFDKFVASGKLSRYRDGGMYTQHNGVNIIRWEAAFPPKDGRSGSAILSYPGGSSAPLVVGVVIAGNRSTTMTIRESIVKFLEDVPNGSRETKPNQFFPEEEEEEDEREPSELESTGPEQLIEEVEGSSTGTVQQQGEEESSPVVEGRDDEPSEGSSWLSAIASRVPRGVTGYLLGPVAGIAAGMALQYLVGRRRKRKAKIKAQSQPKRETVEIEVPFSSSNPKDDDESEEVNGEVRWERSSSELHSSEPSEKVKNQITVNTYITRREAESLLDGTAGKEAGQNSPSPAETKGHGEAGASSNGGFGEIRFPSLPKDYSKVFVDHMSSAGLNPVARSMELGSYVEAFDAIRDGMLTIPGIDNGEKFIKYLRRWIDRGFADVHDSLGMNVSNVYHKAFYAFLHEKAVIYLKEGNFPEYPNSQPAAEAIEDWVASRIRQRLISGD